ncbi:hypothetical protein EV421DRAFT_1743046 [Armillaria borealis]|uniref:Uncharacterized protein n=1 Tax=Armillaria borealis TaxID=47425 RepID=A0AA39IXQ8_9AGAR|nr:hypothetical protein EV421DRAFT_1743046 [Armillaria borealis]
MGPKSYPERVTSSLLPRSYPRVVCQSIVGGTNYLYAEYQAGRGEPWLSTYLHSVYGDLYVETAAGPVLVWTKRYLGKTGESNSGVWILCSDYLPSDEIWQCFASIKDPTDALEPMSSTHSSKSNRRLSGSRPAHICDFGNLGRQPDVWNSAHGITDPRLVNFAYQKGVHVDTRTSKEDALSSPPFLLQHLQMFVDIFKIMSCARKGFLDWGDTRFREFRLCEKAQWQKLCKAYAVRNWRMHLGSRFGSGALYKLG